MNQLFDITDVCRMLGTTSRTLRFYEQKGLIKSTIGPFSSRRQYSNAQIQKVKNVLVLRSLGLPIRKIQELQKGDKDLVSAVSERRTEVLASITSKIAELNILNESLSIMESGKSIYESQTQQHIVIKPDTVYKEIARICTDSIIAGKYEKCHNYFNEKLKTYLPLSSFERVCSDTIKPLGKHVMIDKTETDNSFSNIIYVYLRYEKLGLYVKYVFNNGQISGIWLNYFLKEGERK